MKLSEHYEKALLYALEVHRDQKRKGTEVPYFAHLIAVSSLVLEYGGTEEEAIAALLHDAAEDQGGRQRLADIREQFGEGVARMVEELSDTLEEPKPDWKKRKEAYIAHLKDADPGVRLIAAADKLHNARAILRDYREVGEQLWERFRASREQTLWYYRSLEAVLEDQRNRTLMTELKYTLLELETEIKARVQETPGNTP